MADGVGQGLRKREVNGPPDGPADMKLGRRVREIEVRGDSGIGEEQGGALTGRQNTDNTQMPPA